MSRRLVVVLLLFFHDLRDCLNGGLIFASQNLQLLLEMPENNTLDRNCGCCDGVATKQPGEDTEGEPACTAEQVAAATRKTAAAQLGGCW